MIIWGIFDSVLSTIVSSLFLLTVIVTIVVVVLDNRNPVKTLAWVLVLSFLPVIGLVLYFFFGRDIRREKLISKRGYDRLTKYPLAEFYQQKSSDSLNEKHPLIRFFRNVNGALPFEGNTVRTFSTVLSPTDRFSVQAQLGDNFPSMRLWFEIDRVILTS